MNADVVGLIPAAGRATRLGALPFSKELFPVGSRTADGGCRTPKVAIHYLLDAMRAADITRVYVVLRDGKWDIPAFLGSGATLDVSLAYLVAKLPYGPPYTLDTAYPFVKHSVVAFGFPDILFEAPNAFAKMSRRQEECGCDLVLGLFPTDKPEQFDMVDVGDRGEVRRIDIKPRSTQLRFSWELALWTPAFTEFLHEHLAQHRPAAANSPELSVGNVIQLAIDRGLRVEAVRVSDHPYVDIGTPDGLREALDRFAN